MLSRHGYAALLLAGVAGVYPAAGARGQDGASAPSAPLATAKTAPSSPAFAPPPTAASPGIEQVVVTATRRKQLLRKVPESVQVVSGAQIKKLQIFDFREVQELTPGLELNNDTGRLNTATLRGVAFDPDSGAAPAVDTYFNEIPIDANTAFLSIYDVGQFEVLNGPQGLFRGRTSPAGSITVTTQPADVSKYTGYVQGTVGTRDVTNFQGAANFPIIPDKLAVRIAAVDNQNDVNNVHDITNNTQSRSNTESTRVSVAYDATPDLSFKFAWQNLYTNGNQLQQVDGPGALLASAPITSGMAKIVRNGPTIAANGLNAVEDGSNRVRQEQNLYTFSGDWRLDGATISLTAGHQNANFLEQIDQDSGNAVLNFNKQQQTRINYELEYGELRVASNDRDFWNYSAGTSYYRLLAPTFVTQPNNEYVTGIPGLSFFPNYALVPVNVAISLPSFTSQYSGFAASSFQLAPKLKFEAGVRYTYYSIRQQSFLTVNANGATVLDDVGTISPESAHRNYSAFTGGADLNYAVTPDTNAYLSYGHSYRPGTAAVGVTAPLANALIVTNPETSNAIELGSKNSFDHNRFGLNVDVFYQKFDGYIGRTPVTINASSAANGVVDSQLALNFNGDAVSTGIEAQFDARVLPLWDVAYNMSWVDAQYKNALEPCNQFTANGSQFVPVGKQVVECPTSSSLANTSKFHMTLTSDYSHPLENFTPFIRGVFTYSPSFHSSYLNYGFGDLPILNVYAGIRSPNARWELSIFAKNALNINRITNLQSEGTFTQSTVALNTSGGLSPARSFSSGYTLINTTVPIEAGISLRYNF